jgi:hypothetical protein
MQATGRNRSTTEWWALPFSTPSRCTWARHGRRRQASLGRGLRRHLIAHARRSQRACRLIDIARNPFFARKACTASPSSTSVASQRSNRRLPLSSSHRQPTMVRPFTALHFLRIERCARHPGSSVRSLVVFLHRVQHTRTVRCPNSSQTGGATCGSVDEHS